MTLGHTRGFVWPSTSTKYEMLARSPFGPGHVVIWNSDPDPLAANQVHFSWSINAHGE